MSRKNANPAKQNAEQAAATLAANLPAETLATAAENVIEAKFERNAPNGELTEQEKYFQLNTSNTKERAYAVNNSQLSVADLPANFPTELLTGEKQAEFAALHSQN